MSPGRTRPAARMWSMAIGIEADEAIHVLIAAMSAGLTCEDLRRAVPVHPTVSELIPTLLGQLEALP